MGKKTEEVSDQFNVTYLSQVWSSIAAFMVKRTAERIMTDLGKGHLSPGTVIDELFEIRKKLGYD